MRSREQVVDDALVLAAQSGHVEAFERLVERWHPRLLRHARRLTGDTEGAREAVQDAWLAVVRGLRGLQDPARFGAWVFCIATRRSADWIERRRRTRRNTAGLNEASLASVPADAGTDDLGRTREMLRRLEPERRALLALFYVEGLSVAEIACVLAVPIGTVKSRLHHARERLRAALEV